MEPIILSKNYQPPPPPKERLAKALQEAKQKVTPYLLKFKKPKYITIMALVGLLIVVLLAFTTIAKTRKTPEEQAPEIVNVSQNPSPSPQVNQLSQKVTNFESKLESSDAYQKALIKPIVELDLGFEKR